MIRIILYCIISIIIIFFLIIKLCFRFWSMQPVFHAYNPLNWIYSSGIINYKKPKKNKFFDLSITTIPFHNISTEKKALIMYFLQSHHSADFFTRIFRKRSIWQHK